MLHSTHAQSITEPMQARARAEGELLGVAPALSEYDQLLSYFIHHAKQDPEVAVSGYFHGGKKDARAVANLIESLALDTNGAEILEFAAGFGRVTRHLKSMLPNGVLKASDVHVEACEFIAQALGVPTLQSTPIPFDFKPHEAFDFIFCLSFFSHVPESYFGPWVKALYERLKPGGMLMVTTHGEHALHHHKDFFSVDYDETKGFGFRAETDQPDISFEHYGCTVVSDTYMLETFKNHAPDATIVSRSSGTWFGLQDHWVIKRPA